MDFLSPMGTVLLFGGGGLPSSLSDDFNRADGSLGNGWLGGATWQISSNAVVNTPSLGGNLVTNGEFTSATTGWSVQNSATLTKRDSTVTPGVTSGGADVGCLEVANGGVANGQAVQSVTVTNNRFYRVSARGYSPSANTVVGAVNFQSSNLTGVGFVDQTTEDAWQDLIFAARATSTSANIILRCEGSTSGDKAYYDAVNVQLLTLSELLNLQQFANVDGTASIKVTLTGKLIAGIAFGWDDPVTPANGAILYIDNAKYYLDKLVAGTWSNVASGNITYAAGNSVKIIKSGTTYTLFYGTSGSESQLGTAQTINDVGIVNNHYHGMFNTGSTLDSFQLAP